MSLSAFVLVDAILLIGNHAISEYLPVSWLNNSLATPGLRLAISRERIEDRRGPSIMIHPIGS